MKGTTLKSTKEVIKLQGTIKKIIRNRGYGFIETDEHEDDIFFHRSKVRGVFFEDLKEGNTLEFEIEETDKGPQAINITKT